MKWTKELEIQLRILAFEEKSNKEISEIMNIPLEDVYAGRSRFGITIAKVNAAKENGPAKRTTEVIEDEIKKVQKARSEAYKKIKRCDERLAVLEAELFKETIVEIARR